MKLIFVLILISVLGYSKTIEPIKFPYKFYIDNFFTNKNYNIVRESAVLAEVTFENQNYIFIENSFTIKVYKQSNLIKVDYFNKNFLFSDRYLKY